MKTYLIATLCLIILSCNSNSNEESIKKWKKEIVQTELDFSEMSQKEGMKKAFLTYAAEDVVLMRNNELIIGIDSLRASFAKQISNAEQSTLTWKPDFIDVASSGDLGYTYGKYVYTTTDSLGIEKSASGIFHTVWKRQPDGKWRFVWD